MSDWLLLNGLPAVRRLWVSGGKCYAIEVEEGRLLHFPEKKPAAFLTIDDRAMCFAGAFPRLDQIDEFEPWNKGGQTYVGLRSRFEEIVRNRVRSALSHGEMLDKDWQETTARCLMDAFMSRLP